MYRVQPDPDPDLRLSISDPEHWFSLHIFGVIVEQINGFYGFTRYAFYRDEISGFDHVEKIP